MVVEMQVPEVDGQLAMEMKRSGWRSRFAKARISRRKQGKTCFGFSPCVIERKLGEEVWQ